MLVLGGVQSQSNPTNLSRLTIAFPFHPKRSVQICRHARGLCDGRIGQFTMVISGSHTVGGRNPAPPGMYNTL